jgi:hypothetical protein
MKSMTNDLDASGREIKVEAAGEVPRRGAPSGL